MEGFRPSELLTEGLYFHIREKRGGPAVSARGAGTAREGLACLTVTASVWAASGGAGAGCGGLLRVTGGAQCVRWVHRSPL